MRRQMTPKDQLEDLERRESVLKEEAQHFRKVAGTEESIFEDAEREQEIRDELAEIRKKREIIELAMKSRGVVA